MDWEERLLAIGKKVLAYAVLIIFFLFCWFVLGIRDTKLMLILFFSLVFVFAVIMVFYQEQAKKMKAKEPTLIVGNVKKVEYRSSPQTPHLHINAEVCNTGKNAAYNCVLKVVAYQEKVRAVNTQVPLGLLGSNKKKSVNETIQYSGENLTGCEIWPEWEAKNPFFSSKRTGSKHYVSGSILRWKEKVN